MWTFFWDTHTRLTALCPGLPGWSGTRKAKPIWILLKQETLSGNGISWAICKSAPCSRQITTPAPHRSVFYRPDALPATQPTVSKHWRRRDTVTLISVHVIEPSCTISSNIIMQQMEEMKRPERADEGWRQEGVGLGMDRKCCMVVVSAEHIVTACVQYSE